MMLRKLFSLGLLLPLVVACAAGPAGDANADTGVPDWVLNTPDDPRYVHGVGSAPLRGDPAEARRAAADRARSDLISNMRVTVAGETTAWVERVREGATGPVTRGFAQEVRASVPETTLDEIEIVEAVPDGAEETLYVLARLDRPAATMRLGNQLRDIREQLDLFREREIPTGDRIRAVRALKPAAELIGRADSIEQQLSMVSTTGLPNRPVADDYADVLERLWEALNSLRLDIDDSGMESRLRSGLREGLIREGLRVGGDGSPDLIIGGELRLRNVQRGQDHFAFAEGEVVIREPDGRVIGQFRQELREASSDPGLAQDRVIGNLADSLGQSLGERLFQFL
ncbi:hypothetical protein VCB98_07850 [Gammaproteobacteria bacterium AB-CW1]|uniref:LPP20 lipoprotein n=1 Tax=Natronospira elongata TaxID=3110268 RepID=A0AAP6JGJ8_9GAMM|nr:hypothetical protein [Gammaproteobacteria bacterium AB-CW1]